MMDITVASLATQSSMKRLTFLNTASQSDLHTLYEKTSATSVVCAIQTGIDVLANKTDLSTGLTEKTN
jgi:hypothetical protein